MIVFSSLQIRRGVRVLLDNASATINPGQKVGLVGKNGCGKSTLLSLLKNEIGADAGSFTYPGNWQLAWVNQETPALSEPAHADGLSGCQRPHYSRRTESGCLMV
jgi:ATP-binding cassette subfamily F protein 3